MKLFAVCFLTLLPLAAQAPAGWNQRTWLGADLPADTSWFGAGVWAANKSGVPATLIDSLGMGNALTGEGVSVEAGLHSGAWSFAFKGLANADGNGNSHFTLYQSHATYLSPGGWHVGFEQEPLVWGYGLNGGYLLGEADRPTPKFRVESPMAHRSLFGVPLGNWGFDWFTGRLAAGTQMPDNIQDPAYRAPILAANENPSAPFLSGYRLQANFLDERVEIYANWLALWGGTVNGQSMTSGYSLGDYLTAMTGTKDILAENDINFQDPNHPQASYVNAARSSTNFDMGCRIRQETLAALVGADKAWFYVSRGTKGMTVNWGTFKKRPLYYAGQDISTDGRYLLQGNPGMFWNNGERYLLPNEFVPNDTVGFLFQWPGVRFGLEYQDTVNMASNSYRSFVNSAYPAGFYTQGDPLGEAMGGEAITTTARLELDLGPRMTSTTWLLTGHRPFRDNPADWSLLHPGAVPVSNRYSGLQETFRWQLERGLSVDLGGSWQHQDAGDYVQGNSGNGVRWFADLAYRWSQGNR